MKLYSKWYIQFYKYVIIFVILFYMTKSSFFLMNTASTFASIVGMLLGIGVIIAFISLVMNITKKIAEKIK